LTFLELKSTFFAKLESSYSKTELLGFWNICLESILQSSRSSEIINAHQLVETSKMNKVMEVIERLKNEEPIQYILGEAWFCDSLFKVSPDVLIPRPETEELVYKICEQIGEKVNTLLDIGTGSGCIPISIKKIKTATKVFAIDISENALKIAEFNSFKILGQEKVKFECMNVLNQNFVNSFEQKFDIIVSNPPYIIDSEMQDMRPNVLNHEPHVALFCGDDALLFYRTIADHAKQLLNTGGLLFFEINEKFGSEVEQLLTEKGFQKVTIYKDFYQKDRIIKAEFNL
jgi:release factor glutamine methyltransferase